MRLSDIMSQMGYAVFAEIGLVIFFLAFVAVAIGLMFGRRSSYDSFRSMALDDALPKGALPHDAPTAEHRSEQ